MKYIINDSLIAMQSNIFFLLISGLLVRMNWENLDMESLLLHHRMNVKGDMRSQLFVFMRHFTRL